MAKNESNKVRENLIKDRVITYHDFTYNLLSYIFEYYLDKETLGKDEDIRNHYMFCYRKTCIDFLEEGIDFNDNSEIIEYFFVYYYNHFYKANPQPPKDFFIKFWEDIFDLNKPKKKNVLNILIELYCLFDESIKNKKKILEFV